MSTCLQHDRRRSGLAWMTFGLKIIVYKMFVNNDFHSYVHSSVTYTHTYLWVYAIYPSRLVLCSSIVLNFSRGVMLFTTFSQWSNDYWNMYSRNICRNIFKNLCKLFLWYLDVTNQLIREINMQRSCTSKDGKIHARLKVFMNHIVQRVWSVPRFLNTCIKDYVSCYPRSRDIVHKG